MPGTDPDVVAAVAALAFEALVDGAAAGDGREAGMVAAPPAAGGTTILDVPGALRLMTINGSIDNQYDPLCIYVAQRNPDADG